jgi:hypothetical protein
MGAVEVIKFIYYFILVLILGTVLWKIWSFLGIFTIIKGWLGMG